VIKGSDNLSHGTHVAGIIGAKRNNGKGIDGIADQVILMPIVATTAKGDERDKDVANAIRYAVDNGARIINMSFSKRFSSDKQLVDEAFRYAEQNQVLIIHAAGNDGNDLDTATYYPIPYDQNGRRFSNLITVGWSRPLFNERLAHPNSNYGQDVDLFAPGSDILSTVPGNSYDYKSGSSMSTPVVTGVAALLWSYFPKLTMLQLKTILLRSTYKPRIMVNRPGSKTLVPFSSLSATGGILNARNAVEMAKIWQESSLLTLLTFQTR
jgi:subtilisin family serine protease